MEPGAQEERAAAAAPAARSDMIDLFILMGIEVSE